MEANVSHTLLKQAVDIRTTTCAYIRCEFCSESHKGDIGLVSADVPFPRIDQGVEAVARLARNSGWAICRYRNDPDDDIAPTFAVCLKCRLKHRKTIAVVRGKSRKGRKRA